MPSKGKKIVLAASNSESSEYLRSTWRQMLLATLPSRYVRLPLIDTDWSTKNEINPDGQAKYVPHGLRIIESLLSVRFSPTDVAVCYPDQLEQFVGEDTRVVGIHAHNPLGITFATDIYPAFFGKEVEPVNATEFRKLILHPVLQHHKAHLKVIVGGPGSWQIEKKNLQDAWQIDCVVDGEGEDVAVSLFEAALRGEPRPTESKLRVPNSTRCRASITALPSAPWRSPAAVAEAASSALSPCEAARAFLSTRFSIMCKYRWRKARMPFCSLPRTFSFTSRAPSSTPTSRR